MVFHAFNPSTQGWGKRIESSRLASKNKN
jgi:hypothetical protein